MQTLNFNQIYSTYYSVILNFIKYRINSTNIAEELTNEVFMRVNKHLDNFDDSQAKLATWIYNIAKNMVIDHYRHINKERQLQVSSYNAMVDSDEKEIFQPSIDSTPHDEMVTNERLNKINQAIDNLPEIYRVVAKLAIIDGCSYNEIVDLTQQKLGSVKGRLSRAKDLLKIELQSMVEA